MPDSLDQVRRALLWVLFVLVLANAFAAALRTVADSDVGWHLATGRYVVQHREIPSVDVLSYTSGGQPWIYPPFAGVLLYGISRASGYSGLSWCCAFASAALFGYLARRRTAPALFLALCAISPVAFRMTPRADLFTAIFFAIFLAELWAYHEGSKARLWLLPVVMLFWVNFHPGFIAGLAIILAYLLIETCDLPFAAHRSAVLARLRKVWPWTAATLAVTLLNPWGPKLYAASLYLAGWRGSSPGTLATSAYIGEFLPVPISSHTLGLLLELRHPESGYAWLMVAALVVIGAAIWQRHMGVAAVQAVALYASLQHARYISLFCVTTVVLGATVLERLAAPRTPPGARSDAPSERVPAAASVVLLVFLCIAALVRTADFVSNRTHVVFNTDSRFGAGESSWFPEKAAEFIQRERLPGNIFEEFAVGGFAAWRLGPEYPDFIDGRADHLNPALLVSEQEILSHPPDEAVWRDAAERWGINVLLISEGGTRSVDRQDALGYCRSASWRPVYLDEVSLVLLRNTPANRPWIDRLEIDCRTAVLTPPKADGKDLYDFYLHVGGLMFALQRYPEAESALVRAAGLFPEDANAQLWLAQLYQRQRDFRRAEAAFQASLARQESDKTWYELGRFYAQTGRLPEAAQAIQRAAHLSLTPFVPYIALGEIDLSLDHPRQALEDFAAAEAASPYRSGTQALTPGLYAQIAAGRARANLLLGNIGEAIRLQREAVRLAPDAALRWNQLADLLQAAGQPDAAAQARQRARELTAYDSQRK